MRSSLTGPRPPVVQHAKHCPAARDKLCEDTFMRILKMQMISSSNPVKVITHFLVLLTGPILATSVLQLTNSARADVWVERMLEIREHDFGTLDRGKDAVWRFPATNTYKHKISLVGVRSNCGCTTASLEKNDLDPAQTGCIVAKFNTRLNPGVHNATLTLQTSWNDNGVVRTGEAAVKVSGTVRASIAVEPDEITFTNVLYGKPHEQQLRVSAEHDPAWRLKTVQCSCENLQVALPELLTSSREVVYEMPVRLSTNNPWRPWRATTSRNE